MSTKGTNASRTAHPDHPRSWNRDTSALSITTEAIRTTSASSPRSGDPTPPISVSVAPTPKATIDNTIEPATIGAPHQNRNSSLPIRLEIMVRVVTLQKCPADPAEQRVVTYESRLMFLVLFGNCPTVQLHPTGQLPPTGDLTVYRRARKTVSLPYLKVTHDEADAVCGLATLAMTRPARSQVSV
jgi:hypothetical protein